MDLYETGDLGESDFVYLTYLAARLAATKAREIGEDQVLIRKSIECEERWYARWLDAVDLQDGTDAEIADCEKDALDAIITYLYDLAQERADAEDSSNRL